MDGLTATQRLAGLSRPPKVIVLTTFDLDEYVRTALRAGAVGFLLKDASATEMLAAIRHAARGDAVLAPPVTRRLLRHFAAGEDSRQILARQRVEVLTAKEREVLIAVGNGLSNTDIARQLHLSEATVKTHISRILAKLDMTNRVQAAIAAHHAGLLDNES